MRDLKIKREQHVATLTEEIAQTKNAALEEASAVQRREAFRADEIAAFAAEVESIKASKIADQAAMQRQMKERTDFARNSINQARQAASQAEARASAAKNAVLAAREDSFSQSPIKKEGEFLDDAFDPNCNAPFISVPGFPPANTLGTMRGSTT